MPTKITKKQQEIIDAHYEASNKKKFDYNFINNRDELIEELKNGKTIKDFWDHITNELSVTSQIALASGHVTDSAKKIIRNNFRNILNSLNIK